MLLRTKIFISYRRSDSPAMCDRIYQWLAKRFGAAALFKDIDTVPLGVDFTQTVRSAISQSAVVIVIIGKTWLTTTDGSGRWRLDNPDDFVRQEVELALQQNVPVIPLFVDGAMPPAAAALPPTLRPLTLRNGRTVHYDPYFVDDMRRVCHDIEPWVQAPPLSTPPHYASPRYQSTPIYSKVMPRPARRVTLRARLFVNALPIFQQMKYIATIGTLLLLLSLIGETITAKHTLAYTIFGYMSFLLIIGSPLIASFIVARQANLWRWGVKGAALLGMTHGCILFSISLNNIASVYASLGPVLIILYILTAILVVITGGGVYALIGMLGAAAGKLSLRLPLRAR